MSVDHTSFMGLGGHSALVEPCANENRTAPGSDFGPGNDALPDGVRWAVPGVDLHPETNAPRRLASLTAEGTSSLDARTLVALKRLAEAVESLGTAITEAGPIAGMALARELATFGHSLDAIQRAAVSAGQAGWVGSLDGFNERVGWLGHAQRLDRAAARRLVADADWLDEAAELFAAAP